MLSCTTEKEDHESVDLCADHLVPGADEVVHLVRQVLTHLQFEEPVKQPATFSAATLTGLESTALPDRLLISPLLL